MVKDVKNWDIRVDIKTQDRKINDMNERLIRADYSSDGVHINEEGKKLVGRNAAYEMMYL